MITIRQIKAARALLGWTQNHLAKAAGLSLAALNNIERDTVGPRQKSLQYLKVALERGGVEFLEGEGVRIKSEPFEFMKFEGHDFITLQTRDILSHIAQAGFIYMISSDEQKLNELAAADDKIYQEYVARHAIDERIIVPSRNTTFLSQKSAYRWLPPYMIGNINWMVYGDRIGFLIWQKPHRSFVIHNPSLAGTLKKQFIFMWEHARPFA